VSSSRERQRLADILDNIVSIEAYVAGASFLSFAGDRKTIDACERCLQRISEAAIKIGEHRMMEIAPHIPFHELRGLGNTLRHEYDRIDDRTVFDTISEDLPRLKLACVAALTRCDGE
jgi:uncharacterized protein with HEPN domain